VAAAAAAAVVVAGGRSEPVFSFFFPLCWALSSFDKEHKDIQPEKKGAGATTQLWGPLFFLPFSLLGFETSAGPIRSPKI
jgi:hypothetical protein